MLVFLGIVSFTPVNSASLSTSLYHNLKTVSLCLTFQGFNCFYNSVIGFGKCINPAFEFFKHFFFFFFFETFMNICGDCKDSKILKRREINLQTLCLCSFLSIPIPAKI